MYLNNNNKDSLDDIGKIPYITFLRIGNSLFPDGIEINLEDNIKSISKSNSNSNLNYTDELGIDMGLDMGMDMGMDLNVDELEKQKSNILKEIEELSLSNKKLSDKIKENQVNLTKLNNNKFSFFFKSNKENLYKTLTNDQELYNETFEKISELYEDLIQLKDKIKKLSKDST